jgi:hypothetical protein
MVLAVEEDSRQREDYSYEHAEAFYRVNTERHFLVNAMHQLAKILNNVPWNISISEQLQGTIRDLRNALEHLDEWDAGHSFRRIRERALFDEPTSHRWTIDGRALLGGLLDTGTIVNTTRTLLDQIRHHAEASEPGMVPFIPPQCTRRGVSVSFNELFVHDADNLADFVKFASLLGGSQHDFAVQRPLSGHARSVDRQTPKKTVRYTIGSISVDDLAWLEAFKNRRVMVRDPYGGVMFGMYRSIERTSDREHDVTITVHESDQEPSR